jgi:hypothetical protein
MVKGTESWGERRLRKRLSEGGIGMIKGGVIGEERWLSE